MITKLEYTVSQGDPLNLISFPKLEERDINLLDQLEIDSIHNPTVNVVDLHIFSLDGRLLTSKENFTNFKVIKGEVRPGSQIKDITLFPEEDILENGYKNGDVNVLYNFLSNLYSTNTSRPFFFIESISSDRTELRLLSNNLTDEEISSFSEEIKSRLENELEFNDFRLNFGNNRLYIGVNLDYEQYGNTIAVLVKLYRPLSLIHQEKDLLRLEELVSDSIYFRVDAKPVFSPDINLKLKGPNFNVDSDPIILDSTPLSSELDLFNLPVTSSYYEVFAKTNNRELGLSIDYTDFETFINFSSIEERIKNFKYKIQLLETYENNLALLRENNACSQTLKYENLIKDLFQNFDHYDTYLYFNSGSWSWPKQTSSKPYRLYSSDSNEVENWYSSFLVSASFYDVNNINRLVNTIPSFIKDDDNNSSYNLFVDMIGHHFDNIWIYNKNVSKIYDADNRLDFGIPKDLTKDALQRAGIRLYESGETVDDLFKSLVGAFPTGSLEVCLSKEFYIQNEDDYIEVDQITGRYIAPNFV